MPVVATTPVTEGFAAVLLDHVSVDGPEICVQKYDEHALFVRHTDQLPRVFDSPALSAALGNIPSPDRGIEIGDPVTEVLYVGDPVAVSVRPLPLLSVAFPSNS